MEKETLDSQIAFWSWVAEDNPNEKEVRYARGILASLLHSKKVREANEKE